MKERRKEPQKDRIKYTDAVPTFRLVAGEMFVGGMCSKCEEQWPITPDLRMPYQFLIRFSKHSREMHPLDPDAHLHYLFLESKNNHQQSPQNTRYISKRWQPTDL